MVKEDILRSLASLPNADLKEVIEAATLKLRDNIKRNRKESIKKLKLGMRVQFPDHVGAIFVITEIMKTNVVLEQVAGVSQNPPTILTYEEEGLSFEEYEYGYEGNIIQAWADEFEVLS